MREWWKIPPHENQYLIEDPMSALTLRIAVAVMLPFAAIGLLAQDAEGCKDHPLISRYPGSTINECSQKAFDEYDLPLGKYADGKFEKAQHLEGKVTAFYYTTPEGRSVLEIFRNYDQALKNAGFQTLFTCKACGDTPPHEAMPVNDAWGNYNEGVRFLSAKLARDSGDAYVALWVYDSSFDIKTFLAVVEVKPMESGLVTVNAAALAGDLSRTGHASVYGIYFDTGKAEVKPESDAALKEIAKLLQQDAKLKLYVVGHTDNVGQFTSNSDLSHRRADAVVKILSAKYGVAATRLDAQGVASLAPLASNDSEDGRAKNRRVELVKQ